jgi:hypothetical protein
MTDPTERAKRAMTHPEVGESRRLTGEEFERAAARVRWQDPKEWAEREKGWTARLPAFSEKARVNSSESRRNRAREAEVMALHRDGISGEQIARLLDLNGSWVRQIIRRAKREAEQRRAA